MDFFTTPPAPSASASESSSGILPRSGDRTTRKIRSACNRCHAQKLRCVRSTKHGSSCERCLKLRTSCRFDPRAPRKPRQQTTVIPNIFSNPTSPNVCDGELFLSQTAEREIAESQAVWNPDFGSLMQQGSYAGIEGLDWPSDLCEAIDATNFTTMNERSTRHPSGLLSPVISSFHAGNKEYDTSDCSGISPTSAVRRLASLNVALYECTANLPCMTKARGISANDGTGSSRKQSLFAIDELFSLTTEFLEVIKSLSPKDYEKNITLSTINPEGTVDQSTLPLITYSQQPSFIYQPVTDIDLETQPTSPFSDVDEGTIFMVVSCHCHLIEIYTSLFRMMQACIEHSLVPRAGQDWAIVLPRLQVGSVISPPVQVDINKRLSSATKSAMYMLTITMLSSQLWEQLAEVIIAGSNVSTSSTSASQSALADAMWSSVTDKTDRLSQTINNTKHLLRRASPV